MRSIEITGGLVGEQEWRFAHEGAGEGDALLFAARELDGIVVVAVLEADGVEERSGAEGEIDQPRAPGQSTEVPAVLRGGLGSIAQQQTGIYPVESPGGWQLIGRTPVSLFDPSRTPPVVVEAGDYIRFVPVTLDDYTGIQAQIREGAWTLTAREHRA